MPVRVVTNGSGETHVAATHYVVDPHSILHLYVGDVNVASYRDWSSVQVSIGSGPVPPEGNDPVPVTPTSTPNPRPHGPTVTVTADDGSVAALAVESVTLSGTKKRRPGRPRVSGLTVPRGGFGSEGASA